MTEELELRYAVDDPAALERWLDQKLAGIEGWHDVRQEDRYFDTGARALARAGYGARLRTTGGRTVVTLKSDVERRGALHRRIEIEGEASMTLDPASWPDSEAKRLAMQHANGAQLLERFTIRQHRRVAELRQAGAACQVCVDRLTIEHEGHAAANMAMLEVELRTGDEGILGELDRLVATSGLVRPEPRNKMTIAEQLLRRRLTDL